MKRYYCTKPCEWMTLEGVCSRRPCPYGRHVEMDVPDKPTRLEASNAARHEHKRRYKKKGATHEIRL
jgi:hypothetical protein